MPDSPSPHDPPVPEPTADLVRRARREGSVELTKLYARLAPALHAWASLRIRPPLTQRLEPEDVMQEVWFRALHRFEAFDPEQGSFRGWVFGIAAHVLIDAFRRLQRAPEATPISEAPEPSDEVTRVSRRLERDESHQLLVERLRGLDSEEQQLVVHFGLEGLSAADVGKLISTTPAAALKRWQRLRTRLRTVPTFNSLVE